MKKLDYIDSLRGLAILMVLITHTSVSGLPDIVVQISRSGANGVQLFYLASAFTLFLSFKYRSNKEKAPIRNFFIRRFFRIAPMYYIAICYYLYQNGFGARYWLGDETHISVYNILANITFTHGFYPSWINSLVPGGWSIAIEMVFYLTLPFLFKFIKNLNQAFLFFISSLIFKFLIHVVFLKFPLIDCGYLWGEYLFLYFPSQLPIFGLGIILYFIISENESIKSISGKSVLIFSAMLLAQLSTDVKFVLTNHIMFGIGFIILAYGLSKYRFILIVNPIINYIGRISFSMYLVHFAVIYWLNKFSLFYQFNNVIITYGFMISIVLLISIMISTIFYYLIEVPFQNIGKKIINRLENKL